MQDLKSNLRQNMTAQNRNLFRIDSGISLTRKISATSFLIGMTLFYVWLFYQMGVEFWQQYQAFKHYHF
jgi:hypothetical protein